MNTTNATHCLLQCNITDLTTPAYNLSINSLQSLAAQVTQSTETNRTVWNIVWSSLTTIFACTWVSCHPNIYLDDDMLMKIKKKHEAEMVEIEEEDDDDTEEKREQEGEEKGEVDIEIKLVIGSVFQRWSKRWWSGLQTLATQVKIVLITPWWWPSYRMITKMKIILTALIVPEFIVMWALRQFMAARDVVTRSKGLTLTHAFFSLMGGFVINDKEQDPICALVLSSAMETNFSSMHLRNVMLAAFSTEYIRACFETLTSATVSVETAAETLADTLITATFDLVAGFGPVGVVFENKKVLKEFQIAALDAIREALDKLDWEIASKRPPHDSDLAPWSLIQTQKGLRRDQVRAKLQAILPDRLKSRLRDLSRNIRKALVSFPEEDIRDRSKRDSLAKTFALAQTTWFIVQCVSRRAQHLPLTEIELMTCAYATLSAATYAFWWHKPSGVQFPLIIRTEIPRIKRDLHPAFKLDLWDVDALMKFLIGAIYNEIDFRQVRRVPTFYSGYLDRIGCVWNLIAEIATAAVFGGIHLFAWNYEFPTQVELQLWRASALIIVVVPPTALILVVVLAIAEERHQTHHFILRISGHILAFIYIISRLSLVVLSLVSLRRLPVGTLTNVDWLTFIPHFD